MLYWAQFSHFQCIQYRERRSAGLLFRPNSISSLSLSPSICFARSLICRWPCSHHNSLSMVVWCSLYRQYAILRSICFESPTNLCCSLETTYQFTKNRMAMDTSSSCYSLSFIYYQPTAHSTYPLARYLGTYVHDKLSFHQHCNKMLQKNTNQFRHIKISHSTTHLFVQSPSFGS